MSSWDLHKPSQTNDLAVEHTVAISWIEEVDIFGSMLTVRFTRRCGEECPASPLPKFETMSALKIEFVRAGKGKPRRTED